MSELLDAINAADVARNAQLDRIVAAGVARPHLDHSDFARAVQVFGWPSDAALGCLLGLVRVAWGSPAISVTETWLGRDRLVVIVRIGATRSAWLDHDDTYSEYRGERFVAALIAALESAPSEAP